MYKLELKDFKINEEGSFSITRPYESAQIIYHIQVFIKFFEDDFVLSTKIITDATACMGGDLVRFSKHFKLVNGVEMSLENFNLLVENSKRFNCHNVNLFYQNYLDIYDKLKQDIIYFDCPWGNRGYKTKESVVLKLDEVEIWKLINRIRDLNLAKYIFLKAPSNVCLDNLEYDCIHMIYNKSKLPSFKLICIRI